MGRVLVAACLGLLIAVSCSLGSAADDAQLTIVALGEGFLTGFGLSPEDALPAKIQAALAAEGRSVAVQKAFVEGSAAGVKWLTKWAAGKALLAQPAGHVVIVELGPSDCYADYTAQSVDNTRANIELILARLAERQIPVLLVGTRALDDCAVDAAYRAAYLQIFPALAAKYGDLLYPDFLDGVRGNPNLALKGYDDPNGAGIAVIFAKMMPMIEELMARAKPP